MSTHSLPSPVVSRDPRIDFFDHHAHCWDRNPDDHARTLNRLNQLRERLGLRPNHRVLEVGCGTGLITGWLVQCVGPGNVTAIDFSSAMLAQARAKDIAAEFRQLDICRQAPPEGVFDLALCFQSFPHFRDQAAALRNLARCLKSQGRLIVLHLVGSEEINDFHRRIGGPVGCDLLPSRHEWPPLFNNTGLWIQALEDRPDLFLMKAVRL
jgi:ubiquinone/menaquinone biosynthesis C-methylase UbiE